MPFKSAEIRWYSLQESELSEIFRRLSPEGMGLEEATRTDHYLHCDLVNTGVKIREGNHEIKVKSREDEVRSYGRVEHWIKWSSDEDETIINTISREMLGEWLAVKKVRHKKVYKIEGKELEYREGEWLEEGCGVEFTKLLLPYTDDKYFTLGLEAFSSGKREESNLEIALERLPLDFSILGKMDSFGYPEFLLKFSRWI